jgi:hypothetical protein
VLIDQTTKGLKRLPLIGINNLRGLALFAGQLSLRKVMAALTTSS